MSVGHDILGFDLIFLLMYNLSRRHTGVQLNRNCYFYGICGQSQISLSPAASSDRNYFSLLIWVAADEGFATVGRV